jgi:hypothetical protein
MTAQRRFLADGMLSEDRKLRLDSLPDWGWETKQQWDKGLGELVVFLDSNHGRKPKDKDKSPSGFSVGAWVYQQRKNWNKLSTEQQGKLSEFDWFETSIESSDERWTRNLVATKSFISEHGRLPKYRSKDTVLTTEKKLGLWLTRQTAELDSLEKQKRDLLLGLPGFSAPKSKDELWLQKLGEAAQEVQSTEKIPPLRIHGKGHPNGGWIRRQKEKFDQLSEEQKEKLQEHPLIWTFLNS